MGVTPKRIEPLDVRHLAQDTARTACNLSPYRRQRDRLPAFDQFRSQRFLQPAQLVAQRRLGDVQALRRAAEMPLLLDRDEVAQLFESKCHR